MKHVFNTGEIAHIWANQTQQDGRNSQGNFYFTGKTIYSYGSHFPIATIEGNNVFFTLRSYSSTTSGHISDTRRAISHKTIIYCYEVPTVYSYSNSSVLADNKKGYLKETHTSNLNQWKSNIKRLLAEIGNPKNRVLVHRISDLNNNIAQLETYCKYFNIKVIKDSELKAMLKLAKGEDIVNAAKELQGTIDKANASKMKLAVKAYGQYLNLWRKFDSEGIKELSPKVKELCNHYTNARESFTHLRLDTGANRLETSKGVQIPVEVAKRAYIALNGCMTGKCNHLSIPVMNYIITQTTDKAIIAGCHTIPKEDIKYIASLLNW